MGEGRPCKACHPRSEFRTGNFEKAVTGAFRPRFGITNLCSVFPRDTGIVFVHTYETANFSLGEFIGQAETMSVVESDPDN